MGVQYLDRLRLAARAADALATQSQSKKLDAMDWLPHQDRFLRSAQDAKWRLLRTGNRLGKTTVAAAETILYALGDHPYDPRPPIGEQWAITMSWSQSLAVQKTLWDLAPKHRLAPGQRYDSRRGFGTHNPTLEFDNGSLIRIKTSKQGTLDMAGFQIGRIWFDEPPAPEVWDECVSRTRTAGGLIAVSLTPVGRDCNFIREQVEEGKILDIHQPMTPEAFVHVRSGLRYRTDDGVYCDADWIEEQEGLVLPYTRPVRIHGEWEFKLQGAFFGEFDHDKHVGPPPKNIELDLYVGIDHGYARGNACSVLVGIDKSTMDSTGFPAVYVLDEGYSDSVTTPAQDAENILGMLRRWGLKWKDLTACTGDIPVQAGAGKKGNYDIEDALTRKMGKRNRTALHPRIRTSKRGKGTGRGSVAYGAGWIHRRMVMDQFHIHPGCTHTIQSLDKWQGDRDSEFKHLLDALRYALKPLIMGGNRRGRGKMDIYIR